MYERADVWMCAHLYIHSFMHTYIHADMHTHMHAIMNACLHTNIHTHTAMGHIYMHTNVDRYWIQNDLIV